MGLFKSITKAITSPFKSLLGGVSDALDSVSNTVLGKPDKIDFIPPEKLIPPPSEKETALLNQLYPYAIDSIGKSRAIYNKLWRTGLLDASLNTHRSLFNRALGDIVASGDELTNAYRQSLDRLTPIQQRLDRTLDSSLQQLQTISKGYLPDSYKQAINSLFKSQLGGILDKTARRGIVNSSITQRAISDALQRANDLQVNYLQQASNLAKQPLSAVLSSAPMQTSLATAPFRYASTYAPLKSQLATTGYRFGTEEPLRQLRAVKNIEDSYLQFPANLYNSMLTSRYRVQSTPIVKPGSPGLLSTALGGLTQGLAFNAGRSLLGFLL